MSSRVDLKGLYNEINFLREELVDETEPHMIECIEDNISFLTDKATDMQRELGCWTPSRGERCDCPACGGYND